MNKAEWYSIGVGEDSGRCYASFPVRNDFADYEEYYEIDRAQFELFQNDGVAALAFVTQCRNYEKKALRIVKPGRLRGAPY